MSTGYVVSAGAVRARPESGTAQARVTIDRSSGCERLGQRILRFAPGRSDERTTGDRQAPLSVTGGHGVLHSAGAEPALEPGTGAFLVPGESWAVDNPGPDDLELVSVTAPCEGEERSQVTVGFADRTVTCERS